MYKIESRRDCKTIPEKGSEIMAGIFMVGERKVRPGTYFRITTNDKLDVEVINGVTAVIFRSDFGPLGEVVELEKDESYAELFGTSGTTDAIREAFNGGALTVFACRLGSGGTCPQTMLQDINGEDCVSLKTKYPGSRMFTVSIREKVTDAELKECVIYCGTKEIEKVTFTAGEGEIQALAEAVAATDNFVAEVVKGKEKSQLMNVSQQEFVAGQDPEITMDSYTEAFTILESYVYNTICVDTEDYAVHLMLQSYINRIFENGSFVQAVVAENDKTDIKTRQKHAAAYDDEKMNYVLNPKIVVKDGMIDGYQTAARIAGMIGAVPSSQSLTHTILDNATQLMEELTPAQITKSETMGCIVLSRNTKKQVWIDNAINTMIHATEDKDNGWKKIRRVKARFEFLRRVNTMADGLVGKVDNDRNGRATVMSQINDIGKAMIEEGKLTACTVTESSGYKADGDSAWFDIDVVDKDSMEHIYLTFLFRYSTNID